MFAFLQTVHAYNIYFTLPTRRVKILIYRLCEYEHDAGDASKTYTVILIQIQYALIMTYE